MEWLDQIVISSNIKCIYFVIHIAKSSKHQNGCSLILHSYLPTDLQTIDFGDIYIKDQDVIFIGRYQFKYRLTIIRNIALVIFSKKILTDLVGEFGIIFEQKNIELHKPKVRKRKCSISGFS